MLQIAHIRSENGALLLPAGEPYDRQLVFEEAEARARRYGSVALQIGAADMRLARSGVDAPGSCANCLQAIGYITYFVGGRHLCASCGQHSLH
jgi:hypothetical protein